MGDPRRESYGPRRYRAIEYHTVSSKHLEISRHGDRLFLRHIGSNPTLIERNGQWWKLDELWIDTRELAGTLVSIKLADTDVKLQM